jgi:hypothetical protein
MGLLDGLIESGEFEASLFEGEVLDTAAALDDLVRVRLDSTDLRHFDGPFPWMPRGVAMPSAGDRALVGFSDAGEGWIVAWRPA